MYKLLPLALSVMLTACAVGPDYQAPQSVPLASYSQADAAAEQQASEQRFWSGFNDPQLAALVDRALAQNLDVQTLLARYQGAEALLRGARRDRWPSVTLQAAGGEQHLAEVERTDPNRERVEQYSVGAVASWELDFYGRLQRAVEAGEADLSASAADLSAL